MPPIFTDRTQAGEELARLLHPFAGSNAVVLGLARGGVEVGAVVAHTLALPFRPLIVRKIGAPDNPELGLGAISENGSCYLDSDLIQRIRASKAQVHSATEKSVAEIDRQRTLYELSDLGSAVLDRIAIVVDDGVATGGTMRVAITTLLAAGAHSVIAGTPVASAEATRSLARIADDVVVVRIPEPLYSVGLHYASFEQVTDAQVMRTVSACSRERPDEPHIAVRAHDVVVSCGPIVLRGILSIPHSAHAVVVFAHGSGSGRHSPRNTYVARVLHRSGFSTFLPDLLTEDEARDHRTLFDIPLLASRLNRCLEWLAQNMETREQECALFGASTGAAAAVLAAADGPADIRALISRGGRVDLAGRSLENVRCPTLLIVGSLDHGVVALNQHAYDKLRCEREFTLVEGAGHLFEEPGTLASVADLALSWYGSRLGR